MGIVDATYRTITCSTCQKTVTYENVQNRGIPQDIVDANLWIKSNRIVLSSDGRNFSYCSDLCEIAGIETGQHNVQEAAKVEIPTSGAQAQIAAAAAAAKRAEDANKAIKEGKPVTLHTS